MEQPQPNGPGEPTVKIIEHLERYRGFFKLEHYRLQHSLYQGGMGPVISRELFERGSAVAVLPYDPTLDRVVLVEQFRIGALNRPGGPWLVEIVAGIREQGEDAEQVAYRESREEAGVELQRLEKICEYYVSPGGTSERITLYVAKVDSTAAGGVHGLDEEGEDIRVLSVELDQALEWLDSGIIDSSSPIIALQWLRVHRQRLQTKW